MTEPINDALKLENQLCFPLYAASRKLVGAYTPLLKPFGLTYTQYILFLVLWEQDGLTVSEICERLMLDSGTVTPLLKKLETREYLRRERCENDERCVRVFLTESGRYLKNDVSDIPAKICGCIDLSSEKKQALCAILNEILSN